MFSYLQRFPRDRSIVSMLAFFNPERAEPFKKQGPGPIKVIVRKPRIPDRRPSEQGPSNSQLARATKNEPRVARGKIKNPSKLPGKTVKNDKGVHISKLNKNGKFYLPLIPVALKENF